MEKIEKIRLRTALSFAFSPSAPVSNLKAFSGRHDELPRVTEAIFQRGQHAVIYGERGVGKTSLANVLADWLQFLSRFNYQIVRYNCAATSTFHSMWEGIFRELSFKRNTGGLMEHLAAIPLHSYLPQDPGSEDVRFLLQQTGSSTVIILDEYDRIPKGAELSGLIADTVKTLSDHAVDATLILIGVADSIDDLISEHKSIERALVQIQLPRMSESELLSIIEVAFKQAGMEIEPVAKGHVAALSQGLPHNTHKLGLLTGYAAVESGRVAATSEDVESGIKKAVEDAQQTVTTSYCLAVASPHQNNIYKEILLAAALSKTNDLGYFAAGDLRDPLAKILHKTYGIDGYMRHLNSFCEESRGRVLEKKGERRRYRFRFRESIMEPYVIMRGIAEDLIDKEDVSAFRSSNYNAKSLSLF
jgi:hypothetical protein